MKINEFYQYCNNANVKKFPEIPKQGEAVVRYQESWLYHPHGKSKTIHAIPMFHPLGAVGTPVHFEAQESQKRAREVLQELKSKIIGLEGFTGNRFSIDECIRQTKLICKTMGIQYSWKSYRTQLLQSLKANRIAADSYVFKNKVLGLGIERFDIYQFNCEVIRLDNLSKEARLKIINEWAIPRTFYALARCMEALFANNIDEMALPFGATHIDHLKIANNSVSVNIKYHEYPIEGL